MKRPLVCVIALAICFFTYAHGQTDKPASVRPPAEKDAAPVAHDSFRLEYTIMEVDGGRKVSSRTYAVTCEDGGPAYRGSVKIGSRIPVPIRTGSESAQFTYLDIGINIDAHLRNDPGGALSLESNIEMSSVADESPNQKANTGGNPVVRQFRTMSVSNISLGKPLLIATADDVASHRQFQIQVLATRNQ